MIDPDRRRFLTGLIGAPIAHSASPAMHERAADALGVRCHYHLIEVDGAGRDRLRALLEGVRRLGFAGVNVTFPYKEAVVDLLGELSPRARAIGAVNTVVVHDGRLIGHNTDATGFERALGHFPAASSPGPVALIGAGGVGKAIAFALAARGIAELNIFDRDRSKAEHLAKLLPGHQQTRTADSIEDALRGAVGMVNATPGCCRTATRRCRKDCCIAACGWLTRSIRRFGRRCCRRQKRAVPRS
jgi:shikimate dehydrogenase